MPDVMTPSKRFPDDAGFPALKRLTASTAFQRTILGLILVGAVIVGLETYPSLMADYGKLIHAIDWIIIALFTLEAALKIAQHGRKWHRYFRDPWNVFDFIVVTICLLPLEGHFAAVLRLARVLRALRLVTALPRLQLLVSSLFKSIPSMGYVGLLLFILFYVYGVMGVALFRDNDPTHFGNLKLALLTLFRVVTLEDWTDVMYTQMLGHDRFPAENPTAVPADPGASPVVSVIYFVTFILLGTMIMLNLFIGVIISSMEQAQKEAERSITPENERAIEEELEHIEDELHTLSDRLATLRRARRGMQTPRRRTDPHADAAALSDDES